LRLKAKLSEGATQEQNVRRIATRGAFPRFYPILDAGSIAFYGLDLFAVAEALRDAGVRILQYRDKQASNETLLLNALRLHEIFSETTTVLVMNDHPAIAREAGLYAVHVGQKDGSLSSVRSVLGKDALVGLSTHNSEQVVRADATDASYLAIGPAFATGTKLDADPVVGLSGVTSARALTGKPLVAIGGITFETAQSVYDAGADSIAVISDLYSGGSVTTVLKRARDFLALLK